MATPTYNSAGQTSSSVAASTLTLSSFSANAGSNRFLEVWVGIGTGGTPAAPTGVTWGGNALTQRGTVLTAGVFSMSKWYLKEASFPGGATGDIVATWASSHDERALAFIVTDGVDQTNPYRNGSQASEDDGAATGPSINITSDAADFVTGGAWIGNSNGAMTALSVSAGTQRATTGMIAGGYEAMSVATVAGAGTATLTWAITATSGWSYSGMMADSLQGAVADTVYSAGPSLGIQNYIGFQASQIGLHRNIQPGIAYFNAEGFAPSTSAGLQIDAAVGYANAVGFGAQAIYDSVGIAGRINFNTGTHQTHVTREFFGLLGQLRALGFLVDQTNSQGFFPNLGSIVFQGPTGATVTVFTAPTTFTATSLLRETHFVGFQAQTIRDFFPISANTHALGFTPQYVEFIKEITGPDQGQVNFSGFQAQAIILGQINDAIGQKGEVNLVGFQHAVDMWRTLDSLQGRINMQGFAAGIALFQGGTVNLSGLTGEVNFDTLQQAIGMYRTFYPDSGLTNAEGYVPVPSTGTLVQSIVGILNQEGFIPFIVAERYRGIVGEMRLEGFAPTIGGGLWTPKRRRATSWAAIN